MGAAADNSRGADNGAARLIFATDRTITAAAEGISSAFFSVPPPAARRIRADGRPQRAFLRQRAADHTPAAEARIDGQKWPFQRL
mgnify:CR=1 FL=1